MYRVKDIMERLGVSHNTAYELVHREIPHIRVGRSIRVTDEALDEYIRRKTAESSSAQSLR